MRNSVVLSIDIDYFVSPIAFGHSDSSGKRLSDTDYSIRQEEDVRNFLEQRCKLSVNDKVRGCAIISHVDAFDLIHQGIKTGSFTPPVDLYHVDAHADLGAGSDTSFKFILEELVFRPVDQRYSIPRSGWHGLGAGNWLAYCVANRWIREVWFLPNEDYHSTNGGTKDDLVRFFFPKCETAPEGLQILELIPISSGLSLDAWEDTLCQQPRPEPTVPWRTLMQENDFTLPTQPDYVIVCQSPGFTPQTADVLFEIAKEYIDIEA